MSDTVKANHIYDHEEHGNVLVTNIARMYDEWECKKGAPATAKGGVYVFFSSRYDGYGVIGSPITQEVDSFCDETEPKMLHPSDK